MKKTRVGILGATGMVGQRFVSLLENHHYFEVVVLAASSNSSGMKYIDSVNDRWKLNQPIPEYAKNIIVEDVQNVDSVKEKVDLVFCALNMDKDEIIKIEELYAKSEVVVVSNNSAHRWTEDVPMLMPEINSHHLEAIQAQKDRLGTKKGFIIVKPNCSIQSYVPALNALKDFGLEKVVVSTYQAISGSGKNFSDWPEMVDNVIPCI